MMMIVSLLSHYHQYHIILHYPTFASVKSLSSRACRVIHIQWKGSTPNETCEAGDYDDKHGNLGTVFSEKSISMEVSYLKDI